MSVIPEIILQRAITDGMQGIRKDPRIINMLFKNTPANYQESVKNYILNNTIDFNINYPRTEVKVPAIVLLLKGETESNAYLGDIAGAPPNYDMPDSDMAIDTLGSGAGATISSMKGLPKAILTGLRVAAQIPVNNNLLGSPENTALTFVEDDQDLINETFNNSSSWPCLMCHVVAGSGAGQVQSIAIISSDRLDLVGTFRVNCDSSSVIDIRPAHDHELPYGQPVRSYEVGNTSQLRIGANFDGQYQLDIVASHQEEVIYLFIVLKAILFLQREFLEANGIMNLKTSGSDLSLRSEFLPDECFFRSMTLQFTFPFTFIVEKEMAKAIQITFTNVNPPGMNSGVIITQEIDLED